MRAGPEGFGGAFLPAPTLLFLPGRDINLSESEAEQDGTHNILELPQAYAGRGNMKAQQSAVRLTEVRGEDSGLPTRLRSSRGARG